jgi:hypothetical protein
MSGCVSPLLSWAENDEVGLFGRRLNAVSALRAGQELSSRKRPDAWNQTSWCSAPTPPGAPRFQARQSRWFQQPPLPAWLQANFNKVKKRASKADAPKYFGAVAIGP